MDAIIFTGLYASEKRRFIASIRNQPFQNLIIDICQFFNISVEDMKSKSRLGKVVKCRHVVSFILYLNTPLTLKSIGEHVGNRDHSTIIHSIDLVKDLMEYNKGFREKIQELKDFLENEKNYKKIYLAK